MLQRVVACTVAVVVGAPSVYYAPIFGGDLGTRFAIYTSGVISDHIGFVVGAILGCAAAVFAVGFLAIVAARVTGRLLSTARRP